MEIGKTSQINFLLFTNHVYFHTGSLAWLVQPASGTVQPNQMIFVFIQPLGLFNPSGTVQPNQMISIFIQPESGTSFSTLNCFSTDIYFLIEKR
jgi:hypothetical protein